MTSKDKFADHDITDINEQDKEQIYVCSCCGDECDVIEEEFFYLGTHCTNGISGNHHTGEYVSNCCLAELEPE